MLVGWQLAFSSRGRSRYFVGRVVGTVLPGDRCVLLRVGVCCICLIVLMVVDFFQRHIKGTNRCYVNTKTRYKT
jgi:hypothetical protein